jgi:hypothetical protein
VTPQMLRSRPIPTSCTLTPVPDISNPLGRLPWTYARVHAPDVDVARESAALHFHVRAGCGNLGEAQIGSAYVLEADADGDRRGGRFFLHRVA